VKFTAFARTIFGLMLVLTLNPCLPSATAQHIDSLWLYINIRALPQTVEVHTHRGSYLAVFQVEAQVYKNGSAGGFIDLTEANGTPHRFQVVFGRAHVRDGGAGRITGLAVDPTDPRGNAFVFNIHPAPASEPCRIYGIAGTEVHAQFEAETEIDVITN
jgi:hypothetical protein